MDEVDPLWKLKTYQRKMQLVWLQIERLEGRQDSAYVVEELWKQFAAMESKESELLYAARKHKESPGQVL